MPWLKGQDKTEVFNKKNVKHNALKQRLILKLIVVMLVYRLGR